MRINTIAIVLIAGLCFFSNSKADTFENLNKRALTGEISPSEEIELRTIILNQIAKTGSGGGNISIPKKSSDSAYAIYDSATAKDRKIKEFEEEAVTKIFNHIHDSLFSIKRSKASKKYSEIIDVKDWCDSSPSYSTLRSFTKLSAYYKIYQLSGKFAFYRNEKNDDVIALPIKDIDGEVYEDKTLLESADYIGEVGTKQLNNLAGFAVDVTFYDVVDLSIEDEKVYAIFNKLTQKQANALVKKMLLPNSK